MTDAERAARRAAHDLAGGNRAATEALLRGAELAVMRRLLARIAGGEDVYWFLVGEELER